MQGSFRLGPAAYLDRQPYFQQMKHFVIHEAGVHWIDTFRFLFGDPTDAHADFRQINPPLVSPDDMRDIYDILTELESLAAEKAACHRFGPRELAAFMPTVDLTDRVLAREAREARAAADDGFHAELLRLGGNP